MTKLELYQSQLKSKNAVPFSLLNGFNRDSKNISKYADQITKLLEAFQKRLDLLQKFKNVLKILTALATKF